MLERVSQEYYYIVYIDERRVSFYRGYQNVHDTLERDRGALQTEWRACELIKSVMKSEGRINLAGFVHFDLPVAAIRVQD